MTPRYHGTASTANPSTANSDREPVIIRVSEIPEDGLQIDGASAIERPFADPAWALDDLSLRVEKDGDAVFVSGRLKARVPQVCGRCLEPFQVTVTPQVEARFVPDSSGPGEERELGVRDLDTDVYRAGQLDLRELVVTETTLGLPMKPLCREDCRGLCPVCGGNRNLVPCACETTSTDPRWAALKTLAGRLAK